LGLRKKTSAGIRFSIQSEKDPLYLDFRIEAFLSESVPEILKKMTENDFKLHCSSLRKLWPVKVDNIGMPFYSVKMISCVIGLIQKFWTL
jgi:hypothetical protein